ncbi:5'/3'-nucleotidase SurE [candidate division KSB1 bacterium]|nr:5'/3'-nucleotidase SurE [candidate division KSB1 bacterium]NIR70686.1 5'/3'-nucleotidase SurE [candidate division KSB1 bacterium]NIS26038.1 5'/3'-nucleotidase SurE [candidate division KSB1 bacterium]NIT72862.1 5'/3'-nucleotidase SurE [candidate division KSB1 bacterium]NIU26703.1 5'/3'-nucleotidase SurE [candidate division KSB1 bacterium]
MKKRRPKILLTNDDGISALGLAGLYEQIKEISDVTVVAPDSERSAVGHAITLSDPLRVWNFKKNGDFFGYAVNGTPADCVKIAYWALLDHKPDLLVSGINLGSNTGINVIYSGTVSAATEGTILRIPSFAISLTTYTDPDFTYAAKFAKKLAMEVWERGLPQGTFLNVNVPPVKEEEIQGVEITRQGRAIYKERFDKRIDPQKRVYYWLTGKKVELEEDGNVDDRAILNKKVSITPIHYDLTNYKYIHELRTWEITP